MECRVRRAGAAALLASLLATPATAGPAPAYHFEFISYPGADITQIRGVRSDGVAVGEFTVLAPIPPEPSVPFEPPVVLDHGFFELDAGAFEEFEISGLSEPRLQGVNDAGVLWGYSGENFDAFVFGSGGVTTIDHPDYDNAFVSGVDRSGLVYGTRSNNDPDADPDAIIQIALDAGPFVSDGASYADFAVPGATDPSVLGVRSDGLVWGLDADLGAYLFDGTSVSIIDHPGEEQFNLIQGVSDDGLVLGNQFTDTSSYFLFDGIDYHPFLIPGGSFAIALGMNGDGAIWGSSNLGSFIATPLPEPGTAGLVAIGIAFALWTRRRSP